MDLHRTIWILFHKIIKAPEGIILVTGPTGSGKSRLLADIEWGAQGDTPTKRTVLVNGELMDAKKKIFSKL